MCKEQEELAKRTFENEVRKQEQQLRERRALLAKIAAENQSDAATPAQSDIVARTRLKLV